MLLQTSDRTKEYCLARAAERERMAEETQFSANKAIFRDLARRWRTLGADSETCSFQRVGQAAASPSTLVDSPRIARP